MDTELWLDGWNSQYQQQGYNNHSPPSTTNTRKTEINVKIVKESKTVRPKKKAHLIWDLNAATSSRAKEGSFSLFRLCTRTHTGIYIYKQPTEIYCAKAMTLKISIIDWKYLMYQQCKFMTHSNVSSRTWLGLQRIF